MRFALLTFGCRVNQADSLAVEESLRARGARPAPLEDADCIIVNSCSVTATADQGTRQAVRRAARINPGARLIVTGCYASRCPGEVEALPGVIRVVGNHDKDALADVAIDACRDVDGAPTTADRYGGSGDGACGLRIGPGAGGRTAFTLRVQTGCDEPCSYCIIPSTRGTSLSRPIEWVVEQVQRAAAAGYREVTLTGVHLGAYGRDLTPRTSLAELLSRLAALPLDLLFRLGSLEPMDCTEGVLRAMEGSGRFARAFHLPLQHASDRVLAAMRRPYRTAHYAALVDAIRRRFPDASIGSDIIVGFPGESEDDFSRLVSFLAGSPLTCLHVFPYSDRPGTAAARMPAKVEAATIRERARTVREIGRRLSRCFLESQTGAVHRALVLEQGSGAITSNGLRVRLDQRLPRNAWVDLRLRLEEGELTGVIAAAQTDRSAAAR